MENSKLKLGLQPFWFWNGDMNKEEIVRQIREMKQKGVPGFLIHPRQGMEIPYMSKEFFDRVRLAVQTARENDMEVWIYDEYPYPSGICGGEVILDHPEYLCRRLQKVVREVQASEHVHLFAPWGRVILARAYYLENGHIDLDRYIDLSEYVGTGYQQEIFQYSGLTRYNKKRFFTGDPGKLLSWTAPAEGSWRIYLVTETVLKHFKYFENYIDTLNPEAIQYFIRLTHERYKEQIGEEFGKTVKGFFTDEITAFPDREPWSPLLPEKVLARHGVDLIHCLPALWEDLGEISSRVRYAYRETAADCFIEGYDKAIFEWCDKNGLLYIGEKPILRSRELKYVHIPGIDTGHQKAGSAVAPIEGSYRSNGRLVRSAAHFYDKPAALCEAGHSIGWGMTMQDLKLIFDWLAVEGVNFFVVHGFFYTTDTLRKHDAPPSAFYQMPWWEDASCLASYATELSRRMRSFRRSVRTLVLDPVTSCWTSNRAEENRLREGFAQLQNAMLREGLDYYIIDPELFAEGSVEKTPKGTFFRIHGESYELLLLPPMRNLEGAACRKLLEFAKAGGRIGALSCFPFEKTDRSDAIDELNDFFALDAPALWEAYKEGQAVPGAQKASLYLAPDADSMIRWLRQALTPGLSGADGRDTLWQLLPLDDLGNDGLLYTQGAEENGEPALFAVNTLPVSRTLRVRRPDGSESILKLDALSSRFLGRDLPAEECSVPLSLNQEMEMRLEGMNALRLGNWNMTLPDGQSHCVDSAPVIDQLSAGGFLRPVLQKKYFGCPKELELGETDAAYRTEFVCDSAFLQNGAPVYLVMEPGTFMGEWFVSLNGNEIAKADFQKKAFYLPSNLAADITGLLRAGENLLEAKVRTSLSYGGMRNPLYLFGAFGVRPLGKLWQLSPIPTRGNPLAMAASGLPFYFGEAVFTTKLADHGADEDTVLIQLSDAEFTESARLQTGDFVTAPCAFRPYLFRLPGALLRSQNGEVSIRIRNTALGLFEGEYYDPASDTYLPVRLQDAGDGAER